MKPTTEMKKLLAIALDYKVKDINFDDYAFYTDSEADCMARECILESLWSFYPEFLMAHVKDNITIECIQALQEQCENANPAIIELLNDVDHFVDDAIYYDGRGHFLNTYDGSQYELRLKDSTYIYACRIN